MHIIFQKGSGKKNSCYTNDKYVLEAEKRLKELELEKQRLDDELRAAQEKISKTEITAQALHVHLRVHGKVFLKFR